MRFVSDMAEAKKKWRSIRIPEQMYQQIKQVIVYTGCPSVPEYIRQKVGPSLSVDLHKVDDMKEAFDERRREIENV